MKTKKHLMFLSVALMCAINIQLHAQTDEFSISDSSSNSIIGGAAFDGTNYLVGFVGDSTSDSVLTVQFISQQGQLVGERINIGETGSAPLVAFDGTNYLIVWSDRYVRFLDDGTDAGVTDIYGRFIDPSGNFVGNKFLIVDDAYIKGCTCGQLQFNAGNYFLIYREDSALIDLGPAYGQFISTAGNLMGEPIQISANNAGDVAMAFDGTNYLVAFWKDVDTINGYEVKGQFVSSTGALVGSNFMIDNSFDASDNPVFVVYGGSKYMVSFHDEDEFGGWNLKARLVSTSGNVDTNTIIIADTSQNPFLPMLASDGENFLATWINMKDRQIRGQFYDLSGNPFNDEFVIFDSLSNIMPVGGVASFSGNKYFTICARIVWDSTINITESNYGIYGKFIEYSSGLNEIMNSEKHIKLFPNPATDDININEDNVDKIKAVLTIYDMTGEKLKTIKLTHENQNIKINEIKNGIYLVEIKSKEWTEIQKLIIQR
jgi:hypothetical protein